MKQSVLYFLCGNDLVRQIQWDQSGLGGQCSIGENRLCGLGVTLGLGLESESHMGQTDAANGSYTHIY